METDSIAVKYTVLDKNGYDGSLDNNYLLISLPNFEMDPAYAIIDVKGNIQTIATDRKAINEAWEELTAISYDNFCLTEDMGDKLRKIIRKELGQDLVGYALNYQISNMFELIANHIKPYHEFIKTLGDLYNEHRSDVSDICKRFLKNGAMPNEKDRGARFIKGTLPDGTELLYDTLMTCIEYKLAGEEWKYLEVNYEG